MTFDVLQRFSAVAPQSDLLLASDGLYYGTTAGGGANSYGTIFSVDASGTLTRLDLFRHCSLVPKLPLGNALVHEAPASPAAPSRLRTKGGNDE